MQPFLKGMKELILNKSKELFLKYGLRSVSVDDVCNELRISKKTFYNVFKTKEKLVEGLLEKGLDETIKMRIEECEGETVIDYMRENTRKFIASQALVEKHVAFFYDLAKYYPALYEKFSSKMDEVRSQQAKALIERGQNEGVFRESINVDMASKVMNSVMKVSMGKFSGTTLAERSEEALDYMLRILRN